MAKYIKLFEKHSDYQTFIGGGGESKLILPNVSHCVEENEVHYTPFYPYVDLGLPSGTLWAKMNVGAETITDFGLYFQWGDTEGKGIIDNGSEATPRYTIQDSKVFNWTDYKYANGEYNKLTKYCPTDKTTYWDGDGNPDNLLKLEATDDGVNAAWGGGWHMPSKEQVLELASGTTNGFVAADGTFTQFAWNSEDGYGSPTETTYSTGNKFGGVAGHLFFKSDVSGADAVSAALSADEFLFIPAAGYCWNGSVVSVGSVGFIWSSSVYEDGPDNAWGLGFYSGSLEVSFSVRACGQSLRGVLGGISLQ